MQPRWEERALPAGGLELIHRLERAGFEAWFVGGCVRDLLLGNAPHDWDICTNARPEQTLAVLSDYKVFLTGLQHGTVLVRCQHAGYEITTYRTESGYSDHRRPDQVAFIQNLEGDLARRDFTINAMAYHPSRGLVDCFGGQADLERGLIRAVGDPERRFEEDALRMLRALRFAGRLSFSIEADTARAIHAQCRDLARIAPERVFVELKGLLLTPHPSALLLAFPDLFGVILPEVAPLFGFDQHNPHHDADGWTHTARVVDGVEPQVVLRLAALLHDTGKPDCCTRDAQGVGHFYGHETRSAALAHQALLRLRSDTATREQVELLVGLHDRPLPQSLPAMRRLLAQIGPDALSALLALRRADIGGQSDLQREEKLAKLERAAQLLEQAKLQPCWSVAQLAIAGRDLIDLGFSPGPELGKLLHRALSAVMDGQVENTRAALLHWVAQQERDPSAANQK